MTGVVTPHIQPVGRWTYEVWLETTGDNPDIGWIALPTPRSLVLGHRWARLKARRMMAAELREQERR